VILYDVAVETAAKAALRVARPGRLTQQRTSLPWVLTQLLAEHRELQADDQAEWRELEDARHLHDDRNRVQHHGTVPSPQDLERQRFRATDFISSLVVSFFGRQLAELSRAMLVKDKEVRNAIEAAERSLADGQLGSAVEQLAVALQVARSAFRSGQPLDSRKSLSVPQVRTAMRALGYAFKPSDSTRPSGVRDLERILEALVRRSERAEDRLEALTLGAQVSEYEWFRRRFPRAHRTIGSPEWRFSRSSNSSDRYTREEVIRGLDFVTTVALHWQQFPPAPSPEPDADPQDSGT
jgi:hypothetical protein